MEAMKTEATRESRLTLMIEILKKLILRLEIAKKMSNMCLNEEAKKEAWSRKRKVSFVPRR